ncbi:hypothetical protein EXIGLDRAFT_768215 [Exidia glandulosa HHB12029]|uniref:Uncharacterized protein n=1 Tax=Exidia glandulosa HHB12029 TaxID=1314781 RepID=A0A165IF84_EXIGL|nr:hypothetical protein EXIGLDRAFT_768215 [Exidia glandulosa HHB12029]
MSSPIAYPPMARAPVIDHTPVVQSQPRPAPRMSVKRAPEDEKKDGALRLRGGCLPCPDGSCCFIIPCPCCII